MAKIQGQDGEWYCICGNRADLDGFFPCDAEGNEVEPVAGAWDDLYKCDRCGAIISGANGGGEIVREGKRPALEGMKAYRVLNQAGTLRLAYLQASAKMAFQAHGVNFPYITYSKEIAENVASEYGGKIQEVTE